MTRVERTPVPKQLQQIGVKAPVMQVVPRVHALEYGAQVHGVGDDLAVCGELLRVKFGGCPYRCINGVLEDEGAGLALEVLADTAKKGLYLWGYRTFGTKCPDGGGQRKGTPFPVDVVFGILAVHVVVAWDQDTILNEDLIMMLRL